LKGLNERALGCNSSLVRDEEVMAIMNEVRHVETRKMKILTERKKDKKKA
jgi:hypothetical protein